MADKPKFIIYDPQDQMSTQSAPSLQGPSFPARTAARTGARIGETISGMPGDVLRFLQEISGIKPADIAAQAASPLPGTENLLAGLFEAGVGKATGKTTEELLPTSGRIRALHEPYTKQYTVPQTGYEELYDDIISTATSLAMPGFFKNFKGQGFLKTLGIPLVGATAGELGARGVKELGGNELAQASTKFLLTMSPYMLQARGAVTSKIDDFYKRARASQPEGKLVQSSGMVRDLLNLQKKIDKKDFPGKEFIQKRITELDKLISSKDFNVQELWDRKIDLNKWFRSKQFHEIRKDATPYLEELIGVTNKHLRQSGRNIPGFLDNFEKAEDMLKGVKEADKTFNFLSNMDWKKTLKGSGLGAGLLYLFKAPLVATGVVGGTIGAAGAAGAQVAKIVKLLSKSQQARKIYADILAQGAKGSTAGVIRQAKKFDKVAEKEVTPKFIIH